MSRCQRSFLYLVGFGLLSSAATALLYAEGLASLQVLQDEYPRAYFFRACEGAAANKGLTYDRWEAAFSRLMGIEGKVLDEEVPSRSERNIDFFTRFKKRHPDQLVLLHYNGNARDPRYQTEKYFAGHWIYYNGAKIVEDVSAEAGESQIKVDDPTLFRTGIGRYRTSNDDVGLCILDAHGKPDWHRSEQVQLVKVDAKRKVIRVRRGCYGTEPMAFPAGRAYAAAHVTEGPWGGQSHLLWFYNYSTRCPRDENGRTCADIHADELAKRFLPRGELEAFDGLEFDVLHHQLGGRRGKLGLDCDADGQIDNGVFDRVNTYGIGVVEFCRQLREKLGPSRLMLADGMGLHNQRVFGILNGIESEGWPRLNDWEARDWSGGLNRHWFWSKNAHPPVFNYINHKYTTPGEKPGQVRRPEVPFSIHRLVFAAGMFTDSAICYSFPPQAARGEIIGIWDELRKGTENQLGWLGRPLGPAVRLAETQADLLAGQGDPIRPELVERLAGDGVQFALDDGRLKVTSADRQADWIRFRLRGVPCEGPDLFVSVTARGLPRRPYPAEIARLMWVAAGADDGKPVRSNPVRYMSWLNDRDFTSGFYFCDIQSKRIDLEWSVEGSEAIWIESIHVHPYPDVIYREFQHGLVMANPSPRPYVFDLERLFPRQKFRRLQGSAEQDPVANDGSTVGGTLTLQAKEGLFLVE